MKFCLALAVLFLAHYAAGTGNSRVKRVIGGNPVPAPGQQCSAPYVVIVRKYCDGSGTPATHHGRCAGTIIDDDFILTSSRCVEAEGDAFCTFVSAIEIIAGAQNYGTDNEPNRQTRRINNPTHHVRTHDVGISLVYLDDWEFTFGNRQIVYEADVAERQPWVGQRCRAVGWGRHLPGQPTLSESLLYIDDLQVRQVTNNYLSMSREPGNGAGVAMGDTGGPIIWYEHGNCNEPYLMGVIGCVVEGDCPENAPANHVNVFAHRQWIMANKRELENGAEGLHSTVAVVLSLFSMVLVRLF